MHSELPKRIESYVARMAENLPIDPGVLWVLSMWAQMKSAPTSDSLPSPSAPSLSAGMPRHCNRPAFCCTLCLTSNMVSEIFLPQSIRMQEEKEAPKNGGKVMKNSMSTNLYDI